MSTTIVLVVIVALLFDFVNGWNDSANAIATVVSTRVLAPLVAVLVAAVLNLFGALVSTEVAKMIGRGLVESDLMMGRPEILMAAMTAAASWVAICTLQGMPISGSHSLIGGIIGAVIGAVGFSAIKTAGIVKVLLAMLLSPILGFLAGYLILVLVYWIASVMSPRQVRKSFSILQVVSSGWMAFTHGMNDAQKVMGVITLALVMDGQLAKDANIPFWVKITCAAVMGLGTAAGGWRVIRTLGMRLAHIRPIEGFAAETAAGLVLFLKAGLGLPVSTTHTITGSILGVGSAYSAKNVKWSIGAKMVWAWVLTLPAAAALGAVLAWIVGIFY